MQRLGGVNMIVKKNAKPRKPTKPKVRHKEDWRNAIRRYFAKVPGVDAVFVYALSESIHVYSIVEKYEDDSCEQLMKQESKVEKAFPKVPFEFHTRAHQGRKPSES